MWVLYHNQGCSKSRAANEYLDQLGIEYRVVNYLEEPLTNDLLTGILTQLALPIDEIIRKNEEPFKAVAAVWDNYSQADKITYIIKYPILLQRPIIVHNDKAVIGRPTEAIDTIK